MRAFLSHASEDKEDFVEPLARELAEMGVAPWLDRPAKLSGWRPRTSTCGSGPHSGKRQAWNSAMMNKQLEVR